MSRYRVVFCGAIEPPRPLLEPALQEVDAELVAANPRTAEELVAATRDADAIILHGGVPMPRESIVALGRCKIVARTGVGVDRIDLAAADERGIYVTNAAGCNAIEVAEHTIGLLLALARKLVRMNAYVHAGRWQRHTDELHAYRGRVRRVTGQTLGIVGLGRVGRQVAPRAQGVGLQVIATDPYLEPAVAAGLGVPLVGLDELLTRADFLTLHCPLTGETRHLIDARRIAQMKPGAYLLNCARGEVVDPAALYQALVEGHLAGAALDVTEPEPIDPSSPLLTLENVLVTAHTAANSDESFVDCQRHAAGEVALVLMGEQPTTPVNQPWLQAHQSVERSFGGV
jgi:D-3-phosphoglycerate dehydrogenase